ncbi:MAG: hypothetical protein COA42_17060 [Alteromonadaceae bacterium]|nr:MAG: hypothetical protein COA42_17060 [Alteromonadaceae bacterium]
MGMLTSIAEDSQGQLWIGLAGGGISRMDSYNPQTRQAIFNYLPKILAGMENKKLFLNHELTVRVFSEAIGLSVKDVSATINQQLQCGFLELINRYRIQEAKRLLIEYRDKSVSDVMLESGFNSRSAFYKLFKGSAGLTPSQFRNNAESPLLHLQKLWIKAFFGIINSALSIFILKVDIRAMFY